MPGLGTFSVVESEERVGINPWTRAKIVIPEIKMPFFKASKSLKQAAKKAK
jgi:DNA-binding protein HU-beta